MRRRVLLAAALLSLAIASGARAQPSPVSITQVSDAGGTLTLVAPVLDAAGRPVPGIPAEAFSLQLDGSTVPVTQVSFAADPKAPLAVVLAIDVSGSMAGDRLEKARGAAIAFLDGLQPGDLVSLLVFSQEVAFFSDFTTDRAAVAQQVQRLGAAGNTALYEATIASVTKAASAPVTRKAVVFLTDGENYNPKGRATRQQALDAARSAGVPMYIVGLGAEVDRPYLDDLAQVSRGQTQHAPTAADLDRLYHGIGETLRGQYVVQGRPAPVRRAPSHTVRLTVRVNGVDATAETRFPGGNLTLLPDPTASPTAAPTPTPAPATPAPTPEAIAAPTAAPEPAVAAPASDNAGVPWVIPTATLGALLVIAGGWYLVRRRRAGTAREPDVPFQPTEPPAPMPAPVGAELTPKTPAVLRVCSGPLTGLQVAVDGAPVTIGTAQDCRIVLPDRGDSIERRHARIWFRDGRFMLHRLARRGGLDMSGRSVQWVVLESGDEFAIGPHQFRFQILSQQQDAGNGRDAEAETATAPGNAASESDLERRRTW